MGKSGWAYLVQIVTGLVEYKPIPTEVKVDGNVVFDGAMFSGFVLNGYYNAGGIRWSDEARIDDGILHVVLSEPRSPFATVMSGPSMLSGDWRGVKGIHQLQHRAARVEIPRTRETRGLGDFSFFAKSTVNSRRSLATIGKSRSSYVLPRANPGLENASVPCDLG